MTRRALVVTPTVVLVVIGTAAVFLLRRQNRVTVVMVKGVQWRIRPDLDVAAP